MSLNDAGPRLDVVSRAASFVLPGDGQLLKLRHAMVAANRTKLLRPRTELNILPRILIDVRQEL